jgi:hypothetical protein
MTKEEYFKFHDDFCNRMSSITRVKSQDYTGDSGDPFANFRVCEKLGVCSVETGFLVRMLDKMTRIANLADGRKAAVYDEKIEDSLHDLANYSALFAGYLKSKRRDSLADIFAAWAAEDEECDSGALELTWPVYEIQARNNRGQMITLESHWDPSVADQRMQQLESEWPTFTLTVVPVHAERS